MHNQAKNKNVLKAIFPFAKTSNPEKMSAVMIDINKA
jgi:hypothetical protein